VLDGCALFHNILWNCGSEYFDICKKYSRYVKCQYGNATVVFDGYCSGPSIKDVAHKRRNGMLAGTAVEVPGSVVFQGKKEDFLSNAKKKDKQQFIYLLGQQLRQDGCNVEHARSDAHLLIVQSTIAVGIVLLAHAI
jgi:hypothetical protein